MKTYYILFALAILTVSSSCTKKNERQDKKATNKKVMATTLTCYNKRACPGGPILCAKFGYPRDVAITRNGIVYVVYLRPVTLR